MGFMERGNTTAGDAGSAYKLLLLLLLLVVVVAVPLPYNPTKLRLVEHSSTTSRLLYLVSDAGEAVVNKRQNVLAVLRSL